MKTTLHTLIICTLLFVTPTTLLADPGDDNGTEERTEEYVIIEVRSINIRIYYEDGKVEKIKSSDLNNSSPTGSMAAQALKMINKKGYNLHSSSITDGSMFYTFVKKLD